MLDQDDAQPSTTTWPSPATLCDRLRRARLRAGVSIRDLSERAWIDKAMVVNFEKGTTPSYKTLVQVCDALGVSVAEFLRPETEPGKDLLVAVHQRGNEKGYSRGAVEL